MRNREIRHRYSGLHRLHPTRLDRANAWAAKWWLPCYVAGFVYLSFVLH